MDWSHLPRLAAALERLHDRIRVRGWLEQAPVHLTHEGRTVWQGAVEVYSIEGEHGASLGFAWEEPGDEGQPPRTFTVLRAGRVVTAADAVRASLAARHKGLA